MLVKPTSSEMAGFWVWSAVVSVWKPTTSFLGPLVVAGVARYSHCMDR